MDFDDKDLFVAIDANAIVHRAFHAYPPTLTTTKGEQVNAVYGFTVMLLEMLKRYDPKYVVCAFDVSKKTFRHKEFADYKANRKPTDESLNAQFPLVEKVLKAFNIPIIKKEGFEADDLLGTLSNWVNKGKWKDYNLNMYLLTGDRDLFQLVGGNVYACLPAGSFSNLIVYDSENIKKKYGYLPEQVTDYKAMVGDASDNIPGVKGIGEKTALELLEKYGSLDAIFQNLAEIAKERTKKLLSEGVEQAEFSKKLATIIRDVDISLQLESCLLKDFDETRLTEMFLEFEFRSLISRIPKSVNGSSGASNQLGMFSAPKKEEEDDYPEVTNGKGVEEYKSAISNGAMRVLVYIPKQESASNESLLISVVVDNSGQVWVFNTEWQKGFMNQEGCETWLWGWEGLVSRESRGRKYFDLKKCTSIVDLQLLLYNLSSGGKDYTLSSAFFNYLSKAFPEKIASSDFNRLGYLILDLIKGIEEKVDKFYISKYPSGYINNLLKLKGEKTDRIYDVVRRVEMPTSVILAKMEDRGLILDQLGLEVVKKDLDRMVSECEQEIYQSVGHEFNLNSPKQLADVIYNELGLEIGKRRKKTTREEVLLELVDGHPMIPKVLEYREISKILNTYVTPFIALANQGMQEEGEPVIHTDFKQMGTTSGRFASVEPNLQNLPARGKWGEKIRELFVSRSGFKYVGADYSQIEFRVMADISKDPVLIDDFAKGKDIHAATASRILDKKFDEVSKDERNLGKTVNFAILFGQTPYGLSRLLKIDVEKATEYIEEYFDTYKGVAEYIENAKEMALKYGYVQSMLGRTRYVSGLGSRNNTVRSAAIREAVNMPIQGGEADIMKLAMIEIDRAIETDFKDEVYMLLQIHDEFVFEVKEDVVEAFSKKLEEIMKSVVKLEVPLEVSVSSSDNLAGLK